MKLHLPLIALPLMIVTPAFAQAPQPAAPVSVDAIRAKIDAANLTLSPQVGEVVKMSDAGVNEKTILTYIDNSPGFSLKANDVISLNDRGVSSDVITAMLQHPLRTPAAPTPAPPVTTATVAQSTTANPPMIYPTPATEAVPLTSPQVVYTMPAYGYPSSVIIMGSSYYPRPYYYGGYGVYGGCRNYGFGFRSYGCGPSFRCRF
jgi:hypothetical protein